MKKGGLVSFFETFLKKDPIFLDKKALQDTYKPEFILHRQEQIEQIAGILAPVLRLEKSSNLFLYGKTGTGKTLTIKNIATQLNNVIEKKNLPIKIVYINCKLKRVADTEYRLIAQLAKEFGKTIPSTGLPTDEVYRLFIDSIKDNHQIILLILDEIDQLVKKTGDEILYNLTRLTTDLKNIEISIIGISNDLVFIDHIDPRVRSSLSEEEIVFPPYNALQLQDILRHRAKLAFKENLVQEGVIEKCSAYAARDHGDARRALELLRVAAEISERRGASKIEIDHIDVAEEKIEHDRLIDIIRTQPKQFQLTLYSITLSTPKDNKNLIFTGEVYDLYKEYCTKVGLKPLTQRRVSDIIAELDMLGIINTKIISKGRYGRTREISLAIPKSTMPEVINILKESLSL
ncbi:MAG: ORC1-type DNA replication protein [Candidatus Woesearchaeota archaeon]|nr:MAG: ORC1-type DNA replication protein [Candidatus Woesearchaeota archaeon]